MKEEDPLNKHPKWDLAWQNSDATKSKNEVHSSYTRVYHVHGTPKAIFCSFGTYLICDYAHLKPSNEQRAKKKALGVL